MSETITHEQRQTIYAEGRKAFEDGKPRSRNPYKNKNEELQLIWWYGWDTAKRDRNPPAMPDDPEATIPRIR
jgi:hypothetical protein